MRVHLIGVIKDEADIVGQTIVRAAEVADYVYVRDIGSTDGTLEILQDAAAKYANVIVYSEHAPVYTDDLRRDVFLKFRENSKPGDLWGRYDSDEFILEDPREVFKQASPLDDVLWGSFFNFYMTEKDVAQFDEDPSRYDDDTPIEGRMRYYLNNWSEPRFVRDHRGLIWKEGRDWPSLLNHCTTKRIKIAHYSYRSPKQIDARLVSRWKMSATGNTVSPIDILPDFRERILNTTDVLGTADEITAVAKRIVVEANGVPNITWRDRIIPSSDLDYYEDGEPLIERPDLLPAFPQDSSFLSRGGRWFVRSASGLFRKSNQ